MGYEAPCTLTYEGKTSRGKAALEHKDLLFRGTVRLAVPLTSITKASASAGTLRVTFGGKSADFTLGDAAEKWAKRITNPPSRLDKLGIKPGMSVAAVGVADDLFVKEAADRAGAVSGKLPAAGTGVDALFYGVGHRNGLAKLPSLIRAIKPDGAIWIVRPKGHTDITEAETMAAGKKAGLVDVKVVSFSDTHTAEKFVIPLAKRPAVAKRPKR
jgi:hypothetical protein